MNRRGRAGSGVLGVVLLAWAHAGGGCAGSCPIDPAPGHARRVATLLSGSFSSAQQASADPENYFDIRLHVAPIWASRSDGPWLYVEQAAAAALDKPYRQRVYRVVPDKGGAVRSDVYTLPGDPLAFAGAWADPARFDSIGPGDLTLREGCSVYLEPDADGYAGGTRGNACASDLRGATYATSRVTLRDDRMLSWDRGFDAVGRQVWGAEAGGYEFVRVDD